MKCFIHGGDRTRSILLPDRVDDYMTDEEPVAILTVPWCTSVSVEGEGNEKPWTCARDDSPGRLFPSGDP